MLQGSDGFRCYGRMQKCQPAGFSSSREGASATDLLATAHCDCVFERRDHVGRPTRFARILTVVAREITAELAPLVTGDASKCRLDLGRELTPMLVRAGVSVDVWNEALEFCERLVAVLPERCLPKSKFPA